MRDALAAAMGKQDIFSGEIWVIPDQRVSFGDYDETRRTMHNTRYVVVMQGDEVANNGLCETILVCPLSSQTHRKRAWEEFLSDVESPLTSSSIVKLQLIQPVPRQTLLDDGHHIGMIDDAVLNRMRVHLLRDLGIT
jgi:mRNA-degrading endonuclease toxin of MazEF toxin-antitoxin module